MTVVDVHCHTFNADDLPVRGFIQRLHMRGTPLGQQLAELVDMFLQGGAPGYAEEKARLNELLAEGKVQNQYGLETLAPPDRLTEQLNAETNEGLAQLQARNPSLLLTLARELKVAQAGGEDSISAEGMGDAYSAVRRAIRWVKLFGKLRLDITRLLAENFDDRVDLYTPLLVDLSPGLGDNPKTTTQQQVELHEKISRLSMMGRLPGVTRGRFHPFVGFDPRTQLAADAAGDIESPLDVLKTAVLKYGFAGVKVYPPMGWRPIGNVASVGMTAEVATEVDNVLRKLYEWCEAEEVPIVAHCNQSNYAHPAFADCANPSHWITVLREFPRLHLNLGHFGGARIQEPPEGWPWAIARAVDNFEFLFADVGNHNIYDEALATAYLDRLQQMFASPDTQKMKDRLMFGSDWFMLAIHPYHEEFLDQYDNTYREQFGDPATDAFLCENALRFLGFDDGRNANAKRLRARYETFAPDRMPEWLAGV